MAKRASAKAAETGKEHVRLVVQVREDHVQGLVAEAERRRKPGGVRADVSAVVRDAIDAYLSKGRKK